MPTRSSRATTTGSNVKPRDRSVSDPIKSLESDIRKENRKISSANHELAALNSQKKKAKGSQLTEIGDKIIVKNEEISKLKSSVANLNTRLESIREHRLESEQRKQAKELQENQQD